MGERSAGHKRSKSSLALSMLHRDKSKSDERVADSNADQNGASLANQTTLPAPEPGRHSMSPSISSFRSKRKPGPEAASIQSHSNNSHGGEEESTAAEEGVRDNRDEASRTSKSGGAQSASGGNGTSIEQSVRTFRLFEILRAGDTTAISKAIKEYRTSHDQGNALGTTILHLAIQCAEPQVVEFVLSGGDDVDINARDRDGNTPLHLAAQLGRVSVVRELLDRPTVNDAAMNYSGQVPLDLARTPEIFQQLQLARSLFVDTKTREIQTLVAQCDYEKLEQLLIEPRVEAMIDINSTEIVVDRVTFQAGGTLLHEAARRKDIKLIQLLLMHGADPFRRDKKGKLPQDVTKDERTRNIVKKSPAAVMAQRGIQEKAILGNTAGQQPGEVTVGGKDAREIKGYLKKWTNYTSGYKLRWFVLEDGVLSYYKHQDDAGSACRGAINMRIAKLNMDPQDKTRFEILGKSSVKYHLKANHVVEAKRWFWALNNAIQWAKDEAKEDDRRRTRDAETLRQAMIDQIERNTTDSQADAASFASGKGNGKSLGPPSLLAIQSGSRLSLQKSRGGGGGGTDSGTGDEDASVSGNLEPLSEFGRTTSYVATSVGGDAEDEDHPDYASSREFHSSDKDAFNITAQSVKLQLDLLGNIASALEAQKAEDPSASISDSRVVSALSAYEGAVSSLKSLVTDLLKISRDRDAYWQYRLDRESDARKMWEDTMARVAQEHEDLQNKIGQSEDRRKRTKKALREALESASGPAPRALGQKLPSEKVLIPDAVEVIEETLPLAKPPLLKVDDTEAPHKEPVVTELAALSESESDEEEEFFDAVDAGEIEVIVPAKGEPLVVEPTNLDIRAKKAQEIMPSYRGYEDPPRARLNMDSDDRPKISLWAILKSMIGKDMTKMTLPVSFNEPTSLLQRVAEDMEYTDLIDTAADRADSLERMVYVAAFAASEYASTIGRVAKPFNPLLGETFEYVRPDKGYRFLIEQVSHHPPIGAAYAESPKWDYYGESAVKSKFYGRSFDINPLGTWFLRLRPVTGGEELYTWKKVTSSVIGIITGNPTVDNYGPMEIKNWTTGEVCLLDFKPRGWKASSAYQVTGKVMDSDGNTRWSIGGRWNDKLYARHTPGFYDSMTVPQSPTGRDSDSSQAFLVWQANARPSGIPFNLTPFVVTLNAIPDILRPHIPPTDTRLRPDQRAMEDGEYDFAADEKHRVEEKQRAKRRERESKGEEFEPKWFAKGTCEITGEEYWVYNGRYWSCRDKQNWSVCEDIF